MNNVVNKIKKQLNKVKSYFPTRLPIGMTEFNDWTSSIVNTFDLPDNDSTRFGLAVMITHLQPTEFTKSKRYFAISVKKSMANQIAFANMEELKAKQKAQIAAEQAAVAAKALEVTTAPTVEASAVPDQR